MYSRWYNGNVERIKAMSVSFWGFDGSKKVREIREEFNDLETCKKLVETYRPYKVANLTGIHDAIIAVLLSGYGTKELYKENYCKAATYGNNSDFFSRWEQNATTWTIGDMRKMNLSEKKEKKEALKSFLKLNSHKNLV